METVALYVAGIVGWGTFFCVWALGYGWINRAPVRVKR